MERHWNLLEIQDLCRSEDITVSAGTLSLSSLVVSSHTLVLLSPPTSSAHIIYLLQPRCDQVALSDSPTSSSSPPPGAFAAPGILPGGADEKSRSTPSMWWCVSLRIRRPHYSIQNINKLMCASLCVYNNTGLALCVFSLLIDVIRLKRFWWGWAFFV